MSDRFGGVVDHSGSTPSNDDLGLTSDLRAEAVELLADWIRIDTSNPPGQEKRLAESVAAYLKDAGLEPQLLESAPERVSVVARLEGDGSERPMLLSAHLDVVPADPTEWTHPPFGGEIHDGYLWGRGAVDMKAMLAMNAVIMKLLALRGGERRRDLIFAGVADEEAGGSQGAGFLVSEHPGLIDAEYGLTEVGGFTLPFGERTLVPVQVAEKGIEKIRVTARGRPGHGSLPHDDNSILKLAAALQRFGDPLSHRATAEARNFLAAMGRAQGFPTSVVARLLLAPGIGTRLLAVLPAERRRPLRAMLHDLATPTMLSGGLGHNVIPGECCGHLDGRYLPGTSREEFLEMVRERAGEAVEVEGLGGMDPLVMPYPTPLLDVISRVMAEEVPGAEVVPYLMPGFTDAKHYAKLGMTVYGYAPVSLARDEPFASLYHAPDERISVEGFGVGLRWLLRVVDAMVGSG